VGELGYDAQLAAWRLEHEDSFVRPDGWLSQIALCWLENGQLTLDVGTFSSIPGGVRFVAAEGAPVRLADAPVHDVVLRDVGQDWPDVLVAQTRSYQVVRRGGALAVRVRDTDAPARKTFRGLAWYPVRPAWRVVGKLVATDGAGPAVMRFTDGPEQDEPCPGRVLFEMNGRTHGLLPYARPNGSWLFVFRDETNADETCELFRYFYSDAPAPDGSVVLDFNRAAAPVCALVPAVTCVVPPLENRLALRVEVGERRLGSAT